MGDILIKVIAWAIYGGLFVGLIGFIIWAVRGIGAMVAPRDRIKVYYDDTDRSKGYYYVRKPGGTYPIGYPKEKIVKDMEEFERLKQKQNSKSRATSCTAKKPRPMWLQILLMTPAEYMQYRRRKKEQNYE